MAIIVDVALEAFRRGGGALGMGARLLGAGKKLLKLGKNVRPGVGSAVTKGPLKVGKTIVYGSKGTGLSTAAKIAGAAAGGVGVATVASHRATRPATAPAPRRSAPSSSSTSQGEKKCCPAGTKRMVCFKRGRVKGKTPSQQPHASRQRTRSKKARRKVVKKHGSGVPKRPVSAKQAAARKRFAAAAKKGPIQKGAKL